MRSPILLIAFNRPETVQVLMRVIGDARPPRLYVAVDAARISRQDEESLVARVREIGTSVDWDCEVFTRFQEVNQGCRVAISGAIDWFFECEPEGLILEDDVIPVPSYFEFVDQMLERYRNCEEIGAIAASNHVADMRHLPASYGFSRLWGVWGTATWRRAWANYDVDMLNFQSWDANGCLERQVGSACRADYWRKQFQKAIDRTVDTWDYQFLFALWKHRQLTIMPAVNMLTNIGFGKHATHTLREPDYVRRNPARDITFPLIHPPTIAVDQEHERLMDKYVFRLTRFRCARFAIKRMLGMSP